INLSIAYGSDIDRAREVLLACAVNAPNILDEPATAQPRVRFLNLGVSSLDFQLSVWIDEPALRELVIDEMTTRVYKALNAAGFEIPFPKQDVYVKALPPSDGG